MQYANVLDKKDALELFSKDGKLPQELRPLQYDVNSVTHFGEREFSKNGHRTIIFKNVGNQEFEAPYLQMEVIGEYLSSSEQTKAVLKCRYTQITCVQDNTIRQNRNGLSDMDLRKIDIIYGPECKKRDRQEKIDQCQNYPGVARRKRDIELSAIGPSLRVNRDITAPPINITDIESSLNHLGIDNEVKDILEKVHAVIAIALKNARNKYCNETDDFKSKMETSDVLGMVDIITKYTKSIVDHAIDNITEFCETSNSFDNYNVARCSHFTGNQCKMIKSTKIGNLKYSTNHRPQYPFSTNLYRDLSKYEKSRFRIGNETIEEPKRRKRSLGTTEKMQVNKKDITKKETKIISTTKVTANTTKTTEQTKNIETKSTKIEKEIFKDSTSDIRRRFGDFRVHKQKRDEKPEMFESEMSLETKSKEKIFKKLPTLKNHRTQKKKMSDNWAKEKRKIKEKSESKAPKTVQLSKDNLEFYSERRWPNNVVPYYIKNSLKYYDLDLVRQRLNEVNRILKAETCVHIKEINEYDVNKYQDYLVLDQSPDYVTGRVGGKQVSIVDNIKKSF
ncbi:hypothetical protein RR46_07078 [Papilio xuthus]|uniref:Peptidase M12A domain-containing protein n=1 Tax=Papilio xuthus TaxID=66420 RepID=A0A194Q4M3_PAPXU|nr:hypothetical protein RR46_07078 [Papilio xuthus]